MVRKVTLREPIQFEPGETVYIRINYIDLFKGCSFVITATYPTATHIILNNNTLKIVILTNPTKKHLEFNKNIQLKIIYKCVDTMYIITDISKAFALMTIAFSVFLDPFSTT